MGFIAHPNPQIRAVALQNLVPYSLTEPSVFKTSQLQPIKNLKFLVKDNPVSNSRQVDIWKDICSWPTQKISDHAVTILVNLSGDPEVLKNLATDEKFLDVVFQWIVVSPRPHRERG